MAELPETTVVPHVDRSWDGVLFRALAVLPLCGLGIGAVVGYIRVIGISGALAGATFGAFIALLFGIPAVVLTRDRPLGPTLAVLAPFTFVFTMLLLPLGIVGLYLGVIVVRWFVSRRTNCQGVLT